MFVTEREATRELLMIIPMEGFYYRNLNIRNYVQGKILKGRFTDKDLDIL